MYSFAHVLKHLRKYFRLKAFTG